MKDFIYYDSKLFHFEWENPFKTMNKLKGIFKPLKRYFIWGKIIHLPIIYCSRLEPIFIRCRNVEWKDKWNSPRYEEPPHIWISLFGFSLFWYWDLPYNLLYDKTDCVDDYWEQALWYLYYASYNKEKKGFDELDINKARESWPWQDYETKKSTWNDKFLIK